VIQDIEDFRPELDIELFRDPLDAAVLENRESNSVVLDRSRCYVLHCRGD